jgi:hypothetical protein
MILADLPYWTTVCKWDSVIPFAPVWSQYERIIKPNGAIVLTASQPFTSALVMRKTSMFKPPQEGPISMALQFPCRSESHELEEASDRHFHSALPRGWVYEKPKYDYGVDLRVEVFEEGVATGLELLVQLKASGQPPNGETEPVCLKLATYNHLRAKL